MRSLNSLLGLRTLFVRAKWLVYTRFWGMDIDKTATFSLKANLDRTYPRGVHIGPETYIAFGAVILTHDRTRGLYLHTRIGRRCFIGAHSMILPGITVGDECIVGAGSVVTKDVPAHSVVAGNPARILRSGVNLDRYGAFPEAEETRRRLAREGAFD